MIEIMAAELSFDWWI